MNLRTHLLLLTAATLAAIALLYAGAAISGSPW